MVTLFSRCVGGGHYLPEILKNEQGVGVVRY